MKLKMREMIPNESVLGIEFEPFPDWENFILFLKEKGVTDLQIVHANSQERTDIVMREIARDYYHKVLEPEIQRCSDDWGVRVTCHLKTVIVPQARRPFVEVQLTFLWKMPPGGHIVQLL